MPKELSWTPKRKTVRGKVLYCSEDCGRGCTWAEFLEAKRAGKALAVELGSDWKSEVLSLIHI